MNNGNILKEAKKKADNARHLLGFYNKISGYLKDLPEANRDVAIEGILNQLKSKNIGLEDIIESTIKE